MFIAGHHDARAHYIGDYGPRDPGGDSGAEHAGCCYANGCSGIRLGTGSERIGSGRERVVSGTECFGTCG